MKRYNRIGIIIIAILCALLALYLRTITPVEVTESMSEASSPSADDQITGDEIHKQEEIIETIIDKHIPDEHVLQALKEAKEAYADTVAWLYVPGTDINQPVMQSDNNSDYLNADEEGNYSGWGCYFADYYANLASPDSLIQNTVIYGHSETSQDPDGKKFTQLFRYLELDFMKENPYMYLTVGEETLAFQIFAVFYTGIDFYYINPYPNNEEFHTFSETINKKSEYHFPDITVTDQDKLLTLSTCSTKYDTEHTRNHRFVVMGKLVETVEDTVAQVEVHTAAVRP